MKKACIFLCILISSFCFSQQKPLDSILPTITKPADSIVFDKAMRFFQKIWAEQKYDIALSYEDILVSLSKSIDYDRGTGDVYNHIGTIYNTTDKYIKAFHNYDKAAICYKKANFERGLAIINNNKGTIEQKRGNDENAVNYLHEANLYFIRTNDSVVLSSTYNNIGNAYSALHNLQLAKEYYIKSIALKRSLKSKKLGGTLNNLALVYIDLKKLDSAKIFLRESLVISKKNNKISSIASAYSRLGSIALMNKDYKKSKKYYDSSYTTAQKEKNEVILASAKQQLGVIAMKTNNFREARTLLEDARQQFKALESTPLLLINYEQSAKLDSARGNFKSAFEWQKRYTQLLEESKSNETAQKIEIAETRFESEMEQLTLIDEQEKREQQNNNELFKYRVFTYIM